MNLRYCAIFAIFATLLVVMMTLAVAGPIATADHLSASPTPGVPADDDPDGDVDPIPDIDDVDDEVPLPAPVSGPIIVGPITVVPGGPAADPPAAAPQPPVTPAQQPAGPVRNNIPAAPRTPIEIAAEPLGAAPAEAPLTDNVLADGAPPIEETVTQRTGFAPVSGFRDETVQPGERSIRERTLPPSGAGPSSSSTTGHLVNAAVVLACLAAIGGVAMASRKRGLGGDPDRETYFAD